MKNPLAPLLDTVHPPADSLMWRGHGDIETWHDARYYYICHKRSGEAHVVLQLTLGGAAFYEDDQGRQLVRQGQAFMNHIPGPFHYGYASESGQPYKLVYLSLVGSECRRWADVITNQFGHVLDLGLDSPAHTMMMAMVRQTAGSARGRGSKTAAVDRYQVSGQIYQLFMTILSQLSQSRIEQTSHISDAVSLIHQQALDPSFNVHSLASQMNCSREYLSRQFRHALHISPSDAITQRRLETACTLLRQSSHSKDKLDNIAQASGFTSANYFCRTFRQHYGVTPGQYRRQPEMILRQRA